MSARELRPDGTIDPRSVAPTWGPPKGYLRAAAECLRERGWDATYDEADDSMLLDVPESDRERAEADQHECLRAAGMPEGAPPPLTDDQLTVLHQHELRTVLCLRGLGYDVPDAPHEDAFKAGYESGDVALAYSALPNMSEAERRRVERACPQQPEGW